MSNLEQQHTNKKLYKIIHIEEEADSKTIISGCEEIILF